MDSVTIIIAAVLLAIAILPFALLGKKYRKQKKQLVKALLALAEQSQDKLSHIEAEGNFAIGINEEAKNLYFARIIQDEITVDTTHLTEIYRCRLNTVSRVLEEGVKVTDRIELVLFPKYPGQPPVLLELYNSGTDHLTLAGELQVAIKWEQIIGNSLKALKRSERKHAEEKRIAVA